MTTTLSERVSQSAFDGSMLRVVLLMDLHEGTQQQFFEAYEQLRHDIASVPGHISDQLCQSFENPSQWLITSEWESAPQYLAWVNSEHHAEQVKPLGACARAMRPLKFTVLRETGRGYDQAARPASARLQDTPRLGAGIVRHALTFTVKPGSEKDVAAILSSYASPAARVAVHSIAEGRMDVCIAGASDSPISPITVACFDAIKATSPNNDDPAHASRPFDADRDGFVLGEGGAVLVLEELEHARARGATVYCEIGGYATFGNAHHMTGLTAEGLEMARAIETALAQAGVAADEIDYVNAHGSGTKQNDRHETAAVKRVLGDHAYKTPMTSIKSMVGHSLGAIGAIELAACVLAMTHQVVPPTANYETPDPECDLDYVPRVARARKLSSVLSVGSGFGGFQSAVVMTRPKEMVS
ncbi:beta-ketoacyl synthase N-terminal-like domain-containing protein [Streptomyces avidinii]